VDAVLVDVDGTLIDSVDVRFHDVRGPIGKGGDQLMPVFVPTADLLAGFDRSP
jgi:hypothetical protein